MDRLGNKLLITLYLSVLLIFPLLAWAAPKVTLEVDHSDISISESVIYSVKVNDAIDSEYPNLEGGEEFEVSLIGPETRVEIVNGVISQNITYRYRLMPKKVGTFKSPKASVRIGGTIFTAGPISIRVSKGADVNDSEIDKVQNFATQQLSAKEVYQGQQVDYQLQSFSTDDPVEFKPDNSGFDGFWSEEIGKLEKSATRIRGKQFYTVRARNGLFPITSGDIIIPARKISLKVRERQRHPRSRITDMLGLDPFSDPFFGTAFMGIGEKILQAPEIKLKVIPLPQRPKLNNLMAAGVDIVGATSLTLLGNAGEIQYGESASISIIMQSEGNLNPVSSLDLPNNLGFRVYEDPPKVNKFESAGKIITEKIFKASLVPENGSEMVLPTLRLQFFNPETKIYEVAETNSLRFKVIGAPEFLPEKEQTKVPPVSQPNIKETKIKNEIKIELPEETWLSSISKKISTQLALLMLLVLATILAFLGLVARIFIKQTAKNKFKNEVSKAEDLTELTQSLNKIISSRIGIDPSGLSNESLKAEIRAKCHGSDMAFALQSLLDEIDLARFSGVAKPDIVALKKRILSVA
jgi:hypothetical protein